MGASRLAERFGRFVDLTADERAALQDLEQAERTVRRGAVLVGENEPARELFVVRQGWLHSSVGLGDGTRQIMHFHFPGELAGVPLLAYAESPETLTAVTEARVAPFARERIAELMTAQPRLAALILGQIVQDRVALADRLASIGRTPARARVALLLHELVARLNGDAGGDSIHLPLIQEDIGDATGLTAVHVNRMLRRLTDDGIIARSGSHVRIVDRERLAAEASFADRPKPALDWFSPSAG